MSHHDPAPTAPVPGPPRQGFRQRHPKAFWTLTILGGLFVIGMISSIVNPPKDTSGATGAVTVTSSATMAPTSATSAEETTTTTQAAPTLKPADFKLTPVIKRKECFGSAGCNVSYRIHVTYVGDVPIPTDSSYEVTYEVTGGEDGAQVNTFTITGDSASVQEEEDLSTSSTTVRLNATVTSVDLTSS